MDAPEAARLLGVAEAEIVDVKAHAGWWHVVHHDMASHEETVRTLPGAPDDPPEPDSDAEGSSGSGSGVIEWMLSKVPDGPAKDVLAWVGDDRSRALAAQVVEEKRDQPRTTLVAALEKVAG